MCRSNGSKLLKEAAIMKKCKIQPSTGVEHLAHTCAAESHPAEPSIRWPQSFRHVPYISARRVCKWARADGAILYATSKAHGSFCSRIQQEQSKLFNYTKRGDSRTTIHFSRPARRLRPFPGELRRLVSVTIKYEVDNIPLKFL